MPQSTFDLQLSEQHSIDQGCQIAELFAAEGSPFKVNVMLSGTPVFEPAIHILLPDPDFSMKSMLFLHIVCTAVLEVLSVKLCWLLQYHLTEFLPGR